MNDLTTTIYKSNQSSIPLSLDLIYSFKPTVDKMCNIKTQDEIFIVLLLNRSVTLEIEPYTADVILTPLGMEDESNL